MSPPRLSIGTSDFAALREPGVLLVDKTDLIDRVLAAPYQTLLFPRPRRFGKSTNLSMLGYFLGKSQKDHSALFQDLAIWRSAEARRHFQRYPIIYLTFKDLKCASWTECLEDIKGLLMKLYVEHDDLLQGPMHPSEAATFRALQQGKASATQCRGALLALSRHLHRHHGQKVVILVDEYDTPLHEAFVRGYYEEAVRFFRGLLSGALKDNDHLFKGVLTGILRIARESLFSDLNNIGVYSLLSPHFAADFGFTEAEVEDLRARLGSPWHMEELQRWYNGYDFGGRVIYNPWSVLSALGRPQEQLQPYWANTASDELIRELLLRNGGGDQGEMESLLRGEGVRKALREDTVLRDIYQDADALWSFLLFTGYLKAEDVRVQVEGDTRSVTLGTLKVPNLEVGTLFAKLFDRWLTQGAGGEQRRQQMLQSLLSGDVERFQESLQRILVESASFHDVSGKRRKMPPEHVYQVFILGLLVSMPRHRVIANREGGHGRYDVLIVPREAGLPGVVLELKVKSKARGSSLERALAAAKKQLLDRDYAAELRAQGAAPIYQVAVAFDGKRVLAGHAQEPAPKRPDR
jgi:hypothetical protein